MKLSVRLAKFLLERGDLSVKDSAILTSVVLNKLGALPYEEAIQITDDGSLMVNGKTLDFEQMKKLRESALGATTNLALNLVFEQIKFLAVVEGVHKGSSIEQMYFGRTAIWAIQNIQKALDTLSQKEGMV